MSYCGSVIFFFLANSRNLATKKKGWSIQQRDLKDFKKQIRHILRTKNLEVARFRQRVPVGRQN
jgi:hypothetical protein